MTQIILSIPNDEVSFITKLAEKMGWSCQTKQNLLDKFIESCVSNPEISEKEIQNEVNEIRKNENHNRY